MFMASICRHGILGGALRVDEEGVTFLCTKLTVDKAYRELKMPYTEIFSAAESGRILLFPTVTFKMKNGEEYRFLIFNRKGFLRCVGKQKEQ